MLDNKFKFQSFTQAFRFYFEGGWHNGIEDSIVWNDRIFAERINKIMDTNQDHSGSARNWRMGSNKTTEQFLEPILHIFFGEDKKSHERKEMRKLWKLQHQFGLGDRVEASAPITFENDIEQENFQSTELDITSNLSIVWNRQGQSLKRVVPPESQELFDIEIHYPKQGDPPDNFSLSVSLNTGLKRGNHGALKWEWGINQYIVVHEPEGCQVKKGSTVRHPGLSFEGGAWRVASVDAHPLRGDLTEKALCRMEHDGRADVMNITLTAKCYDTDVDVAIIDGLPLSSDKRKKMVKRLLQDFTRGSNNDVFLGRAEFTWKCSA